MSQTDIAIPSFAEPAVEIERRSDGSMILTSPDPLGSHPEHLGQTLRHWADRAPDRTFLAEREGEAWRRLSYGEARRDADRIAAALLRRGLGPERPVMILSGNSVRHALLTLGAMQAGIPVAPVSPAYSLMSKDFAKVHHILGLVRPGMIYVENGAPFAPVLQALALDGIEVVAATGAPDGMTATPFDDLLDVEPDDAVERAFAAVGPETVAKYLFTSGSTGLPKGVINTQRMLCANQQQARQCWLFNTEAPPVIVDWLPWNHTFGGNFMLNMVLANGGTLYIDAGRPVPGLIEHTVKNLSEISPTLYANVPAGFGALLPYLEQDADLRQRFFAELKVIFYAGAALPQDLWERLETVSIEATGRRVCLISAWGSTETSPLATAVHWPIDRAGVIGLPVPGVAIKLVPTGGRLEMRVKGPNVTPGYLGQPELTDQAFDEQGFYRIGDAGRLIDPDEPARGLAFDGRVAEDFKLTSGTWVHAGGLRIAALEAAAPLLQDAVVTGHDRDRVGLLAWVKPAACRALAGLGEDIADAEVLADARVREHIRTGISRHNADKAGSSMRIARVLLLATPPDVDANEITDKGYINQGAVLDRRRDQVEALYADPPGEAVIVVDG